MSEEKLKEKAENQYKDKVEKILSKYADDLGFIKLPVPEKLPTPANHDWWGSWRYNATAPSLEYYDEEGKYICEIDLELCNNSSEILSWILTFNDTFWCGPECVGHLVAALIDLLDPQANILGLEPGKTFDSGVYLNRQADSPQQ